MTKRRRVSFRAAAPSLPIQPRALQVKSSTQKQRFQNTARIQLPAGEFGRVLYTRRLICRRSARSRFELRVGSRGKSLQGTSDSSRFGMQVIHRRFQMGVAKHDLQIADKGSVLQRVSGEAMPEMMRSQAPQAAAIGGCSDGALHIGFVTTPADDLVGAPIAAEAAGRKEPSPSLGELGVGIFYAQQPWQGDRNTLGHVLYGQRLGQCQLPLESRVETFREGHHPALVTFGLVDVEAPLGQIEVFDAQVERLADAQTAGVNKVNDESGWIALRVADLRKQLDDLITSWAVPQPWGGVGRGASRFCPVEV